MPLSPNASHARGHAVLPISSITWTENVRQDTPDLRSRIANELAPSIYSHGLIQPIVIRYLPDGSPQGVAGWCRTEACKLLGETEIPVNLREQLSDDEAEVLKLEENIRRTDMPWTEVCLAIAAIHKKKKILSSKDHATWGQEQTGYLLGVSKSKISNALFIADLIKKKDSAILSCVNMEAAKRICLQRRNDEGLEVLQKRSGLATKGAQKLTKQSGPQGEEPPTSSKLEPVSRIAVKTTEAKAEIVPLSKMLFNMDCRDWFAQAPHAFVDLVYTDCPYGIDMDALSDMIEIDRVVDSHEVEENVLLMKDMFEGVYKVLKPDSYFLLWMDLKHWNLMVGYHGIRDGKVFYIPGLAEAAGFTCQMWPIIAQKSNGAKNRAASCWWTKNYECVAVFRKGQANLREAQASSIKPCNFSIERKIQRNPFAKPFDFTEWLLASILVPGMTVLDCYAGGGSLVRGLLNLGAKVIAIEKNPKDFADLQNHIQSYFLQRHQNNVTFV